MVSLAMEVIIQTSSGRPIFCNSIKDGDEIYSSERASLCALIQSTVSYYMQDMKESFVARKPYFASFQSKKTLIGILTVQNLIFVAVCSDEESVPTEPFLRCTLEYLYCQILFVLTNQVHNSLKINPNLDLRHVLGRDTELLMCNFIEKASTSAGNHGTVLASAIEVVALKPSIRERLSSLIVQNTHQALFACLIFENRIVCLIQPKRNELRLSSVDLHLLLHFVEHSSGLSKTESWIPLCLPHFNPMGIVFAYSNFLGPGLALIFISPSNAQEHFASFRKSFAIVQESICKVTPDITDLNMKLIDIIGSSNFDKHIARMKVYCFAANCIHFVFKRDIFTNTSSSQEISEITPQILTMPVGFPFESRSDEVWNNYQKMILMLRGRNFRGVSFEDRTKHDFEGQKVFSSMPVHKKGGNITFIITKYEVYFGMSDSGFEIYAVFSAGMTPEECEARCRVLVREIMSEDDEFFMKENFVWNY